MPQPYDYFGLMGGAANIGGVVPSIQQTLLGDQNIQQNNNVLSQQARAEDARKALAIATDPNAAPELRNQAMGKLQQSDPAQAAALRAQMQQRADLQAYFAKPSAAAAAQLILAHPDLKDAGEKSWSMYDGAAKDAKLSAIADAAGYLEAGDVQGALKVAQAHHDADKAAGLPTDGYDQLIETIQTNPKVALGVANWMLASGAGPEKFADANKAIGENRRANELQPGLVQKGLAEASKAQTEAQYAPQTIESNLATEAAQRQRMRDQTANEQADLVIKRDNLNLERDKLVSGIQLKLEEFDRNGTQLDGAGRTAVNAAATESAAASALADRMNGLADRIHGTDMGWGWMSSAREAWKGAFGGQDPISGLRAEYNQLVNAQAVKNLPPGPASDKDIALAKQGFPPANASGAYLESFLRGMAKMQQAVSASADRRGNWLDANGGSLGALRRDTNIAGVMVPAGTTFTEFNGNAVKRSKQGEVPASLGGILQKYGGGR